MHTYKITQEYQVKATSEKEALQVLAATGDKHKHLIDESVELVRDEETDEDETEE